MKPFVLDNSVAVSWAFSAEYSVQTQAIYEALQLSYAEVPALFFFELQSVLARGERQKRITRDEIQRFWEDLLVLDIRIEGLYVMPVQPYFLELGRQYNLSPYDAAYFDLAQRRGLPLATRDKTLRAAAVRAGIPLLPATTA